MNITISVNEKPYAAKPEYEGSSALIANVPCPVCANLYALTLNGSVQALCPKDKLALAKAETKHDFVQEPQQTLKFRIPRYETGHDTMAGQGECLRCRRNVGLATVKVDTLFGIEEDRRVQGGPWKVF